jgi:hypothetical protein
MDWHAIDRTLASWSLWLLDSLVRLLAIGTVFTLALGGVVVVTATGPLEDPAAGVLYVGVFVFIYLLAGAAVYLPLVVAITRFWKRWQLVAIITSPVLTAIFALLFIFPSLPPDATSASALAWSAAMAATYGALIPAPGRQSLAAGLLAFAIVIAGIVTMLVASG